MHSPFPVLKLLSCTRLCLGLAGLRPLSLQSGRRATTLHRTNQVRMMAKSRKASRDSAKATKDGVDFAAILSLARGVTDGWVLQNDDPDGSNTVLLRRSCRDIEGNKMRSFVQTHLFSKSGGWSPPCGFPLEITGAVIFSPSPSGRRLAIVREDSSAAGNGSKSKTYTIELWDRGGNDDNGEMGLLSRVATRSTHEQIMGDAWFGGFAWTPDETRAIYVAQKSALKARSFFAGDKSQAKAAVGQQFAYRQDWGELYVGVTDLALFLVDFEGAFVAELPGLAPKRTPGQPVMVPDGRSVLYTSWDAETKLGIIYCSQRPCQLWAASFGEWADAVRAQQAADSAPEDGDADADADEGGNNNSSGSDAAPDDAVSSNDGTAAGEETLPSPVHCCLTSESRLARSPRFAPGGKKLIWLANDAGFDTHSGCYQLKIADWDANGGGGIVGASKTLVGVVEIPEGPNGFPGLWMDDLPRSCWQPDGKAVYLTTSWGSADAVTRVNAETGAVTRVTAAAAIAGSNGGGGGAASASVLIVSKEGVLVETSAPNVLQRVGIVPFEACCEGAGVDSCLSGPRLGRLLPTTTPVAAAAVAAAEEAVAGLRWRVLTVTPKDTGNPPSGKLAAAAAALPFEAILVEPPLPSKGASYSSGASSARLPPLLVVPHGGPHGAVPTRFLPLFEFLAATQGFCVLHVNFRGSTGFGNAVLDSLPGRVGMADVGDVVEATKATLALQPPVADASRVGIYGGSHGGFLGAHLTGQYPNLFRAAALLNPVINIPAMAATTDIPDWCAVEALGAGQYDWTKAELPTADQLARMHAASPLAHAANVRAPTLLLIGAKDRRVPPSQGITWHHMLKARGLESELHLYPEDSHPIDNPASSADSWLNMARWMKKHLA